MDIMHVGSALDGTKPDFVRGSDGLSALQSSSRHTDRKTPRVVVPPLDLLIERSATKLAAPNPTCRFQ